jgi:hypothetical protein
MRNRWQFGPFDDALVPASVVRQFAPAGLDIDDLAEAIRLLLGPEDPRQSEVPHEAISALLSLPKRGTHVLTEKAP